MKYKIVTTQKDWTVLNNHVLKDTQERLAFAYCHSNQLPNLAEQQFLVKTIDLPNDQEYSGQGTTKVSLKAEQVLSRVIKARDYAAFIDIHSHPFSEYPTPSSIDREGYRQQREVFNNLAVNTQRIIIVVGKSGQIWAEVWNGTNWIAISEILILGEQKRLSIFPVNAPSSSPLLLQPHEQRTHQVLGESCLEIRRLKVMIIGVGGVGSAVVSQLRGYIGNLTLVDPDIIELHNTPRLHSYSVGDVGLSKVLVHGRAVQKSFPKVKVKTQKAAFPTADTIAALKEADFIFCCPDHNAARYAAAQAASRYLKPLIEVGCGGKNKDGRLTQLGYHVRLQIPGFPCLACNGMDLQIEDPSTTTMKERIGYVENGDLIQGELMPLTTRAAADAVDVFFRYITGYAPVSYHLYFDALQWQTLDLSSAYNSHYNCPLCGQKNILGNGDYLSNEHQILKQHA